ncbi:MAG: hypothetical protein JWL59_1338 [Chthoniobacteraceae bacterium]|nr:hypothetical protein [Chthoniobacteraceae bacterium]
MRAPDYETIFDVETAIETAFADVLVRVWGIPTFRQGQDVRLPIPRVDVQLQLGQDQGHFGLTQDGKLIRDAWHGRLIIDIVTKRVGGMPNLHGKSRARVRHAVQYSSARFGEDELPYHVLSSIKDGGTDPTCDTGDDCDVSSLTYDVIISVRTNAWPEVSDLGGILGDAAGNPFVTAAGDQIGIAGTTDPLPVP